MTTENRFKIIYDIIAVLPDLPDHILDRERERIRKLATECAGATLEPFFAEEKATLERFFTEDQADG
jgi:hypothetical protein